MRIVIDANIVFAALIKKGLTQELIVDRQLELVTPEFVFQEIKKYQELILKKTQRDDEEFMEIVEILDTLIMTIPEAVFKAHIKRARKIAPDKKDTMYIALALHLDCPIWSNDKRLKEQDKVKIYSSEEIMKLLRK